MSISLLERQAAAAPVSPRPSIDYAEGPRVSSARVVVLGRSIQARKVAGWLDAAGYDVRGLADEPARAAAAGEASAVIVDLATGESADLAERSGMEAVIALIPEWRPGDITSLSRFDDFILPTAAAQEAVLRVERAVAHRQIHRDRDEDVIEAGAIRIDVAQYRVWVAGAPVELTHKEFELLLFLARRSGRVVTREELLRRVWGFDVYVGARTVDVHVRRLRQKIDDSRHGLIETVRRVGYRLREAPPRTELGIA